MHNYIIIIIAGITGTLLMTGAMYLLSAVTGQNYKVVGILATMVTNHTTHKKGLTKFTSDILAGVVLHYLIGIIFSFVYFYLWQTGHVDPGIKSSIILGLLTGIVAMVFWSSFIYLHPNPPSIPVFTYVLLTGVAHVLFSLGVYLVYNR